MSKSKPGREKALVFISHITSEKAIAISFQKLIQDHFLDMIEVFVSSDDRSIGPGTKWLERISDALARCVVEIVICSPASVQRPWINFEAGAGWIRDVPVIPLCHSGITPAGLPSPLNALQAAEASDPDGLARILPVIARAIGSAVPRVDFTPFTTAVKQFERDYTPTIKGGQALSTIEGTPFDFPGVFSFAKRQVFLADQNLYDFTKPESQARNRKILADFLGTDPSRRVHLLLCDPLHEAAVKAWTSAQRGEYVRHLQSAIKVLQAWTSDPAADGRLEVRTTSFVPLTVAFVDPETPSGVAAVIPNAYEVKWSRRACFVVHRGSQEEVFMSVWSGFSDRWQNATPLPEGKPRGRPRGR